MTPPRDTTQVSRRRGESPHAGQAQADIGAVVSGLTEGLSEEQVASGEEFDRGVMERASRSFLPPHQRATASLRAAMGERAEEPGAQPGEQRKPTRDEWVGQQAERMRAWSPSQRDAAREALGLAEFPEYGEQAGDLDLDGLDEREAEGAEVVERLEQFGDDWSPGDWGDE